MSYHRALRRTAAMCGLAAALLLTGCDGFFHPLNSTTSTGGTGTGTAATNYAFVANVGANTVQGLGISSTGALTPLSGGTITFGTAPFSMAVTRANTFLYVGTVTQIFGFSISSTGAIGALNNGSALVNSSGPVDMQTSPDGKWLLALDSTGVTLELFAINADGTLSPSGNGGVYQPTGTAVPKALRFNSAGTLLAAAIGTAGEQLFSFDTGTGTITTLNQTSPPTNTSDNSVAWDANGYLYIARSGTAQGLVVDTVNGTNGSLTPTTATVYATGNQPYSVAVGGSSAYVYVANRGDSTITAYSIGPGAALTAVGGSPFTGGSGTTSLATDSSGKFLLAANLNGSPDLSLYGFDAATPGKLDPLSSTSTGTNAAIVITSH